MEYRPLGRSGLRVSVLTLGTMTFGGRGFFTKAGNTDVAGARRLMPARKQHRRRSRPTRLILPRAAPL